MPNSLKIRVILLLISSWVLGLGGISFYTPAMSQVGESLNVSETYVKLTISYFILGKAISMLVMLPFADRFQRKSVLIIGLIAFTLGSIICLISSNIYLFFWGRLLEGIGVSLCILMGRSYINDQFIDNDAIKIFSFIFIGNALAIVVFPTIAGYIVSSIGWRYIFFILGVYGCIISGLIYLWLPAGTFTGNKDLNLKDFTHQACIILKHSSFIGFLLVLSLIDAGEKVITTLAPFIFKQQFHFSAIQYGFIQSFLWAAHLSGLIFCIIFVNKKGLNFMLDCGIFLSISIIPCLALAILIPQLMFSLFVLGLFLYMLSTGFVLTTTLRGLARPFIQSKTVGLATAIAMTIQFFFDFLLTNLVSYFSTKNLDMLVAILITLVLIMFSSWYCFILRLDLRSA